MGVTGLTNLISSNFKFIDLSNEVSRKMIADATPLILGIDGYALLYKLGYDFSTEAANGVYSSFAKEVELLATNMKKWDVQPYFVFDGATLPCKKATKAKNAEGQSKFLDISWEMLKVIFERLRKKRIWFIVAPYEANAQLAYFYKKEIIHGVIAWDSDLMVYGCNKIISGYSRTSGKGKLYEPTCLKNTVLDEFTPIMMICSAIIMGCDYVAAYNTTQQQALDMVRENMHPQLLMRALETQKKIPDWFKKKFWDAYLIYHHQIVFDNSDGVLKQLNLQPLPEELFPDLGPRYSQPLAYAIAGGHVYARHVDQDCTEKILILPV